ncbi:hypothetical protein BDK51DRAFT_20720 [Blyttiomyces helicus]|uniref:PHD-type domain-containing protein n=1 Tax=Blyttiomyces helicus TaxID=388810 RepID=A0A4P9WD73_9FUNG|nr:hypothetical protein BDK51DRAFT_20720 [Blyttiomyces helicus]|eukprot:RKO90292.1 hypothetical protein BDK51DRAFT_20720 [Blyttiomyces helicus]
MDLEAAAAEAEKLYCVCRNVSYGEMIACDGDHCPHEWFHLPCVGLEQNPHGRWHCDTCRPLSRDS